MQHFRSILTSFLVIILCTTLSTEALAKKPIRPAPDEETQTVLSNKDALNLAKLYLDDFQAVDPEFTVNQLKAYILSLNTADTSVIDAAMQAYLASLQPVSTNQSPSISGSPATNLLEGQSYRFTPSASDPDGDSLSFSIANKPAWAGFDNATGTLSGTPVSGSAGLYSGISISVSDGELSDSLTSFTIEVLQPEPVNQAPVISGAPTTSVTEGENYLFAPSASDPDGDSLSFSIANKPAWASFDSATGTLSGTPASGSAGLYSGISISVSDGEMSDSLAAFSIQVEAAPATLEAGPPTLTSASVVGSEIQLTWRMDNAIPEGGYDTFIDGVDTGTQYRTTQTAVSLSGLDLTQSHCFVVESRYTSTSEFFSSNQLCTEAQEVPNQAPVISGTPSATATVGTAYSFTPNASDADGDSLSFSVSNLPAWASFDSLTGTLSGMPESMDLGSHDNILITVSDGTDSSQLASFSIVVEEPAGLVTASLSWAAPATRADGSSLSLSEIDGYRIYMGESESSMVAVMDINDYSVNTYTLTDIPQGDHYFAVTAYDSAGNESTFSNIILKSCF